MRYNIDFQNTHVLSELIYTMVARTPLAYIVLDKQFRVHFINDSFLEIRKLQREAVLGQHCYNLSNNGIPCSICAVRDAIQSGNKTYVLRHDTLPDGTERYMDDYAIPLYKEDGTSFDYILEIMLNRTQEMLLRKKSQEITYDIIKTLTSILDKKDAYTSTHSADVSIISMKLAKFMGLSDEEVQHVGLSALLHDIGKIYTPDNILTKPARLTDEEFSQIRAHPVNGAKLLRGLNSFSLARDMGMHHHERWDGHGYPDSLSTSNIPFGARILAIADTYDAMTSDRSYRKGLPHSTALEEIKKYAGTQFDPTLAETFYTLGTEYFTTREAMLSHGEKTLDLFLPRQENQISRIIHQVEDNKELIPSMESKNLLAKLSETQLFADLVFKNTPAFYTVISEAFDVLFVSDSMAATLNCTKEELLGQKCFEIGNKNMSCFKGAESGSVACPTVRAFHSGKEEYGKTSEKRGDKTLYMDIIAVPVDIHDADGKPMRCVMEILFDRTEETQIQKALEQDIHTLIELLENLIVSLDPKATRNVAAIYEACNTFADCLAKIDKAVKQGV